MKGLHESRVSLINWDSPAQLRRRLTAGVLLCVLLNTSLLLLTHNLGNEAHASDKTWKSLDPQQQEQRIQAIGIARSKALTIAWLGFETPTLHQAQQADVEQSFFARLPGQTQQPEHQPQPQTPQQQPSAQISPTNTRALLTKMRESIQGLRTSLSEQLSQLALQIPAQPATQPTPNAKPLPPGANPSEKESPPTALRKPILVRPGQVLATQGLEIITVKPIFTHNTKLLSSPKNMLVTIRFNRAGRVVSATMIESSGVTTVDEPVMNAIYQWQAKGEPLLRLPLNDPEAGVNLDFRIDVR